MHAFVATYFSSLTAMKVHKAMHKQNTTYGTLRVDGHIHLETSYNQKSRLVSRASVVHLTGVHLPRIFAPLCSHEVHQNYLMCYTPVVTCLDRN